MGKIKADIYNITTGMTVKEARNLRHDLKHFVKRGRVFLASDDSNILYELAGEITDEKVVAKEYIDDMRIKHIIWRDKKDNLYDKVKIKEVK